MLVKSITALAALTFAANVVAEPMPYQPGMMKTSAQSLFGVVRRDDSSGYQPQQAACGAGNTCAEACGAGFAACSTTDNQVHCYNQAAGEICCPNQSGNSCDAGYYCSADTQGETWCCPEKLSLSDCAKAYSVTGGLVSQTATPTTSSTSTSSASSTSTAHSTTTSSTSTSSTSSSAAPSTSSTSSYVPSHVSSYVPSASIVPSSGSNSTAVTSVFSPTPSSQTSTTTAVPTGAAAVAGPASALVLLAAGLAALL